MPADHWSHEETDDPLYADRRNFWEVEKGSRLTALRVLAKSRGPHRDVLIERHIDDYLRTDPFSLAHALERLRGAIRYEELERREGEDCSVAKAYVRSLLDRMNN